MSPNKPSNQVYEACIALGSNVGDREQTLMEALKRLQDHPKIELIRCSSIYETDPVGFTEQPAFLNMAAIARTELDPRQLLEYMQTIERRLGRVRDIRWGPRTIDLDLLLAGDVVMNTPELILPHPRMWERAFVLIPLEEAGPENPMFKESIRAALDKLDGKEGVRLWKTFNWPNVSAHFEN